MVIDTTSREGMESSLAHLMGVSVPELYQYIEAAADSAVEGQWCFNQDLFDKAMEDFYSDMIEQELPDEILFFHLSRRLKGSENEISYNLQELLTSNNSFSEFLNAHQITFRKGAGNRIILCYRDRQIRVVGIMSAYDDLIENNRKQIKLLEEAAQRLYKEWFVDLRFPGYENTPIVDGLPEGWRKVAVNDIADYLNGYAFKPEDWGSTGKPIIKIKEMGEGVTSSTPRNKGAGIPEKYVVKSGDIIFSWSATLAAMIWDEEDGLLNQHLFKVTPNQGIAREYVLQAILMTLDEFRNLTTGSTMKHIQRGKLKEVYVNLPDRKTMGAYNEISYPCRELIIKLKKNITLLTEARDRLLPKLMSGEVENAYD